MNKGTEQETHRFTINMTGKENQEMQGFVTAEDGEKKSFYSVLEFLRILEDSMDGADGK